MDGIVEGCHDIPRSRFVPVEGQKWSNEMHTAVRNEIPIRHQTAHSGLFWTDLAAMWEHQGRWRRGWQHTDVCHKILQKSRIMAWHETILCSASVDSASDSDIPIHWCRQVSPSHVDWRASCLHRQLLRKLRHRVDSFCRHRLTQGNLPFLQIRWIYEEVRDTVFGSHEISGKEHPIWVYASEFGCGCWLHGIPQCRWSHQPLLQLRYRQGNISRNRKALLCWRLSVDSEQPGQHLNQI